MIMFTAWVLMSLAAYLVAAVVLLVPAVMGFGLFLVVTFGAVIYMEQMRLIDAFKPYAERWAQPLADAAEWCKRRAS